MGFACRAEIRFDAKMQSQSAAAKPHAASRRKVWRLGLLDEAKHAGIELTSGGLHPRRHGELHVIQAENLNHATCNLAPPDKRAAAGSCGLTRTPDGDEIRDEQRNLNDVADERDSRLLVEERLAKQ